jgi:DNA-binding MarR family transcriptional regulator
MSRKKHTPAGKAITELILEIFRLNGRLLAEGDRLVAGLGLTSARWQVLGGIALSPSPEPVARLARNMGLNRQGVQRIVNELAAEGLIEFRPNPHHQRAKLVVLTAAGAKVFADVTDRQMPWVNELSKGLDLPDIAIAARLLKTLRLRLEGGSDSQD